MFYLEIVLCLLTYFVGHSNFSRRPYSPQDQVLTSLNMFNICKPPLTYGINKSLVFHQQGANFKKWLMTNFHKLVPNIIPFCRLMEYRPFKNRMVKFAYKLSS